MLPETLVSPNDPVFLTVDAVANLLGTTRKAIYDRVSRGQLPGVIRIGRSIRFRRDILLRGLAEGRAPSSGRK